MRPLSAATLHGVWGTVLLPLEADGSIGWERLKHEIELLVASDLDGVYAHGTAGEFHTLDEADFERVSRLLAVACTRARRPFQIGASHPVPQVTLERIVRTRDLAPGAFQVVLPDWVAPSEQECVAFLSRVAETAAPVPLVLYNPPHAKTVLGPRQLARLVDAVPSVIGIKVVDGDIDWYNAMAHVLERCAVFIPGHRMATGLARGASGSYSNVAALSPPGAAHWYATTRADPDAGADLERRIGELFAHHVVPLQRRGFCNPALDKFLATIGDWCGVGLRVRWPYASVPPDAVEPARQAARDLVPELIEGESL
jgi:dihydrodipicolinate synthase/N-acetylneuraminate lyase